MKTRLKVVATLLVMSIAYAAFAHGSNGVHLKGTVKSVSEGALVLTGLDQKETTVTTNDQTRVQRGSKAATLQQIRTGERAVVHAKKGEKGELRAETVSLPSEPGGGRQGGHAK